MWSIAVLWLASWRLTEPIDTDNVLKVRSILLAVIAVIVKQQAFYLLGLFFYFIFTLKFPFTKAKYVFNVTCDIKWAR
jgi:hypothetical protein